MNDAKGTGEEHGSLSGNVEPAGEGEWITLEEAGDRLGIDRKAVYRRIQRGRMTGKKAPFATHLLVWFPKEPRSPDEEHSEEEEQRSLSVPEQQERFLDVLESALARAVEPLNATIVAQQERIEAMIREEERRSREQEQEQREERGRLQAERDAAAARAQAAEAEVARLRGRRWWDWLRGR